MSEKEQGEISVVEAKMARIEELSEQILESSNGLNEFWRDLGERLAVVAVEVWADQFLEGSTELIFPRDGAGAQAEGEPEGERGLQLGFHHFRTQDRTSTENAAWKFSVRPSNLVHGATLYSTLDRPEPLGEARPLDEEPSWVRLAALQQLPELLNAILGTQNDTLAVVRCALGEPVEAHATVTSPFSRRSGEANALSVVPLTGMKPASRG